MQLQKPKISAVLITLNEEENIQRVITSLGWVDEVVVLDSGSHDLTCEIAKKLGANVFIEPWRGFGPQKKRAVELARNDWILSIDADEVVSEDLVREIQLKFQSFDSRTGYRIPRKSYYLKRWILHGGWYPDYQLRIFNRKYSQWDEAKIHEKVIAEKIEDLKSPLEHYVFKNKEHQVQTNNRYSSLQAQEYIAKGGQFSCAKMIFKPFIKFIECYFFKLGVLDGFAGFVIAVSAAYSVFIRWVKIWELKQ